MREDIPNILLPAMRQYRHNNDESLVFAFENDKTIDIVCQLQKEIESLRGERITLKHRINGLTDKLEAMRKEYYPLREENEALKDLAREMAEHEDYTRELEEL